MATIQTQIQEKLDQINYMNARQVIKQMIMKDTKPGGLRHAWQANIAMLLSDRYGITDHTTRNAAADDIIKLVFEDKYY